MDSALALLNKLYMENSKAKQKNMFLPKIILSIVLLVQQQVYGLSTPGFDITQYNVQKYSPAVVQIVNQGLSTNKAFKSLAEPDQKRLLYGFLNYLTQLKLDTTKAKNITVLNDVMRRLLNSSTQFLICRFDDLACLQKKPVLTPNTVWRQDVADDLGTPVKAGAKFEAQAFLTTAWADIDEKINQIQAVSDSERKKKRDAIINQINQDILGTRVTVEKILAQKIQNDADQGLWMAIYGIDDIQGTMKHVYQAIAERKQLNKFTQAVVDIEDGGGANSFVREYDVTFTQDASGTAIPKIIKLADNSLSYSYTQPADLNYWFFGPADWQKDVLAYGAKYPSKNKNALQIENEIFPKEIQTKESEDFVWLMGLNSVTRPDVMSAVRSAYQYDGTLNLVQMLNANINSNDEAQAHIEWPTKGIMHNKFMVLQNQTGEKFVWTGTTNVAQTCMGNESNSNMAVYIKNNAIADTFLTEFKEMFNPIRQDRKDLLTGVFHNKKRPNTKRYFVFDDGAEVAVHFSPTDDGEHRSIIPTILSAQSGDTLRISMFGGSGIEFVRAIQKAVSNGAKVRIVMDKLTSSGPTMWPKSDVANLLEVNPYTPDAKGSVEVRYSGWMGLNHHKTATLQRKNGRSEVLIIGSQNWSEEGNDTNDENMITVRNKKATLQIADQFNLQFDQRMWNLAEPITKADLATSAAKTGFSIRGAGEAQERGDQR